MDKHDTMKKIERLYMDEIEPQKEVDDKILGKKKRELSPEQKKRYQDHHNEYLKKTYHRYIWLAHYEKDKDIIDYLEEQKSKGISPTQLIKDLIRKEINK